MRGTTSRGHEQGDPIYEELRVVRDLVQEALGVLSYIASDPDMIKRHEGAFREFFGRGRRRADVYLALDRERNITQVAAALGMQRQNVSKEIQALRDAGLITPLTAGGRGDVWIRNPTLESVLRLSQRIKRWYPPRQVNSETSATLSPVGMTAAESTSHGRDQ